MGTNHDAFALEAEAFSANARRIYRRVCDANIYISVLRGETNKPTEYMRTIGQKHFAGKNVIHSVINSYRTYVRPPHTPPPSTTPSALK